MCLGTFPHRARSSVTVCAFARYAHPDTRNISFSLNRICSEGNCQVLYRAATGVGSFSYVSPIGSGIMNLFPAVLIEYTKYFVKRIYSMSSKTKIIVLRMKEIIYTALFIGFAIVLIMLFLFMFRPKKDNISGSTAEQTAENASSAAPASATYVPGLYSSPIVLGSENVNVEVAVDHTGIRSVALVPLSDSVETMYPLMAPSMESIAAQILENQSLEGLEYPSGSQYTSMALVSAVRTALSKAVEQ